MGQSDQYNPVRSLYLINATELGFILFLPDGKYT